MVDDLVSFASLFISVLPAFLLMGTGWVARRREWIDGPGSHTLLRMVVKVFYPALLFSSVVDNPALRGGGIIAGAITAGFLFILGGCLIGLAVAPISGLRDPAERRTFGLTTGVYNYGYFAIPVCDALFGREVTGVLMVVSLGVELAIWSFGILLLSGEFTRESLKKLASPPILALIAALPLNLIGWGERIPGFALRTIDMLGACSVPAGLIIVGATMAELMRDAPVFNRPRIALGAMVVRHGLLPALMLATFWLLPAPLALKQAVAVHAAMPAAVFPVVLARIYGGRPDVALRTVIPSCLLGLITIPLWIQAAFALFGW